MARGSVVASFAIEGFSIEAAVRVTPAQIEQRLAELVALSRFWEEEGTQGPRDAGT
jgi:hypothetical protein